MPNVYITSRLHSPQYRQFNFCHRFFYLKNVYLCEHCYTVRNCAQLYGVYIQNVYHHRIKPMLFTRVLTFNFRSFRMKTQFNCSKICNYELFSKCSDVVQRTKVIWLSIEKCIKNVFYEVLTHFRSFSKLSKSEPIYTMQGGIIDQ